MEREEEGRANATLFIRALEMIQPRVKLAPQRSRFIVHGWMPQFPKPVGEGATPSCVREKWRATRGWIIR